MIYLLASALLASSVNFLMRRNTDKGGSSGAFLTLYFLASFLFSFLIFPEILQTKFSPVMASLGVMAGVLNFLMMRLTAKALAMGPPALSFTFQNASSVMPGLLMYFLFGSAHGFEMSVWLCAGFALILAGLYVSVGSLEKETAFERVGERGEIAQDKSLGKWLLCAISVLLIQGVTLSIFQWRLLFINQIAPGHWLVPWTCNPEEEVWFMPMFFMVPAILQFVSYWKTERKSFNLSDWGHGFGSGVINCFGMFLLLLATKKCEVLSKAMHFPLFTIAVIFFCNLWGWKIYKERVSWVGVGLCIAGVAVGFL